MAKLVMSEKPSVAKSLSAVLGATSKKDGYYEGNGHIVSWCIGRLLGLAPPDFYGEKYAKWDIADLPILPDPWIYKPNESTKKQLKVLKDLLTRSDVETVINACDAGREGELIFRLVYDHFKCKKPVERLWISSMEESAIADGFNKLRKGNHYDNLYQAACQQADWAVGMNYSRLFGCLCNVKGLSIGRVQTPTLTMIIERDDKINNFVKEPFYGVELEGAGFTATREKIKDKSHAETIAVKCNGKIAVIKSVEKHEKSTAPPKLYDLTTLQREANRLFGYSAKQTLEYAQNLYEKKILTYPRTDSRFLTEDMKGSLPMLAASAGRYMPMFTVDMDMANKEDYNFSQIINNSKVTDHHAIIPTMEAANINLESAPGEKNILMMVASRLLSAVACKHEFAETVVTVECEGETFNAKGKTVIREGWKSIEDVFMSVYGNKKVRDKEKEETSLPNLSQGQQYPVSAKIKEGFTSPPRPFTEDTLLSAMENAGGEDIPDDTERKGIGTPATRAEIIETLLKREYVVRKDKQILPTEKGVGVIKILPDADSVKSPILTSKWENDLKHVETGKMSADEFMAAINDYVRKAVAENKAVPDDKKSLFASSIPNGGEVLGKCLRCGNDVIERQKGFFCNNNACKFGIFKDNKFFAAKKKKITKEIVQTLLNEGRIFMSGLMSEKTGKTYNATILLDDTGEGYTGFKMEFEQKNK